MNELKDIDMILKGIYVVVIAIIFQSTVISSFCSTPARHVGDMAATPNSRRHLNVGTVRTVRTATCCATRHDPIEETETSVSVDMVEWGEERNGKQTKKLSKGSRELSMING